MTGVPKCCPTLGPGKKARNLVSSRLGSASIQHSVSSQPYEEGHGKVDNTHTHTGQQPGTRLHGAASPWRCHVGVTTREGTQSPSNFTDKMVNGKTTRHCFACGQRGGLLAPLLTSDRHRKDDTHGCAPRVLNVTSQEPRRHGRRLPGPCPRARRTPNPAVTAAIAASEGPARAGQEAFAASRAGWTLEPRLRRAPSHEAPNTVLPLNV